MLTFKFSFIELPSFMAEKKSFIYDLIPVYNSSK